MWLLHLIQIPLFLMCIDTRKAQTLNPIFQCDFERELCPVTQDPSPQDDFDWTYGRGPTEAMFTGPFADNTFKNESGTYLYIISNSTLRGTVARIRIRPQGFITQGWARIVFFYHMLDNRPPDRLGTLSVEACGYRIWNRTGSQGNDWLRTAMTFRCEEPTQPEIIFEATRGGADSDIAIDDIFIFDVLGPTFTTEGTTSLTQTLGVPESSISLSTTQLTLIIIFSVIGFFILACFVSTLIRKFVMKTFDIDIFKVIKLPLRNTSVPETNRNKENDKRYASLRGQKVDIYTDINPGPSHASNSNIPKSTLNITTTTQATTSDTGAYLEILSISSDIAKTKSDVTTVKEPPSKDGDYLPPLANLSKSTLSPMSDIVLYAKPIKKESSNMYCAMNGTVEQPTSKDGGYLEPLSYLSDIPKSSLEITTITHPHPPISDTGIYSQPISNSANMYCDMGGTIKQPTSKDGDYLQPLSDSPGTPKSTLDITSITHPHPPTSDTGIYLEPNSNSSDTPKSTPKTHPHPPTSDSGIHVYSLPCIFEEPISNSSDIPKSSSDITPITHPHPPTSDTGIYSQPISNSANMYCDMGSTIKQPTSKDGDYLQPLSDSSGTPKSTFDITSVTHPHPTTSDTGIYLEPNSNSSDTPKSTLDITSITHPHPPTSDSGM